MSTASVARAGAPPVPANRPNIVSMGTIVWLSSELMFFAALFAMYFTIRSVSPVWPPEHVELNIPFTATNATILVLSSVTCQIGVFAAERGDVRRLRLWFTITFFMGLVFILGQGFEYIQLVREGLTLSSEPYGSVFYLLTGFHGMHVTGGLLAFLLILGRTFAMKRFTHGQATSAIVVSYYWHFVDVVWVGLYLTIYIIQ